MRPYIFFLALLALPAAAAEYVGSDTCAGCHSKEAALWQDSHHHDAMLPATDATVAGDFADAEYTHFEVTSRFFRRGDDFLVNTEDSAGKRQDFTVRYTFGVHPLQQYLVEFPGGRLQALSVAWDNRAVGEGGQRWFHLYPDEPVPAGDVLHWSRHFHNWNLRCAECHSTGLQKNYSPVTDTYQAAWSEVNVACEACHGPGSGHAEWAAEPEKHAADTAIGKNRGFDVDLGGGGQWQPVPGSTAQLSGAPGSRQQLDVCAPCHSRRSVVETPVVGDVFLDNYRLALLTPDLYHPDGQILDEVYVYGSFVQSKMYAEGVVCTDCHNPHSAEVYVEDNGLCVRCHSAETFDTPSHHHHAEGSAGAQCVECHMPETTYMVVDPRRDHSLRIPNPLVTEITGAPNACSACHSDQPLSWVLENYRKRHGNVAVPAHAISFHRAQQGASDSGARLAATAMDVDLPAFIRASAVELLAGFPGREATMVAAQLVYDDEALIRRAGATLVANLAPGQRVAILAPLLEDDYASVRAEAARVLASMPTEDRDPTQAAVFQRAEKAYLDSLQYNLDAPGVHLNLGATYSQRGDRVRAEAAYRQALKLDDRFLPALLNLADVYRAGGEDWRSRPLLKKAIQIEPSYADAHYAMGLLLVRQKRYEQAREYLSQAVELRPDESRYTYVYAVALHSNDEVPQAVAVLERGLHHRPEDLQLLVTLAQFHAQAGDIFRARAVAERALSLAPGDQQIRQLVSSLSR